MNPFDAPIPGQSLTNEPKKYLWERPPETSNPDEAMVHHMERLSQPEVAQGLVDALEGGMPVSLVADMLTTGGVANGIHSIDISLIIKPALEEYITTLAERGNLKYKRSFPKRDDSKERAFALAQAQAASNFANNHKEEKVVWKHQVPEVVEPIEDFDEVAETPFMTRRNK